MENNNQTLSLSQLDIGEIGQVVSLESNGIQRRRMLDLGLVQGTKVKAVQSSPSGDPVAYNIRGAVIALRNDDADKIQVKRFL
ncbi:MAG: ferrous iron transport protein A [Clostridiales bacterium]|nr:ferrous iron transport protein A [Clostridiales bacterium]